VNMVRHLLTTRVILHALVYSNSILRVDLIHEVNYHHLIKRGSKLLVNWHKQERQIIDFRRGLLLLSGLFGVHVMT